MGQPAVYCHYTTAVLLAHASKFVKLKLDAQSCWKLLSHADIVIILRQPYSFLYVDYTRNGLNTGLKIPSHDNIPVTLMQSKFLCLIDHS